MGRTVLAEVDGWTPVIDNVVLEVGAVTALVFGKVWRYCQMADNCCSAAQSRIADELGMSRQTINQHIGKLVEAGFLREEYQEGLPNKLYDTGKAGLSISITSLEPVKNIDTQEATCQKIRQEPVKKFDTKKVLKDTEELNYIDDAAKPARPSRKKPTPEETIANQKAKALIDEFTELSNLKPVSPADWGKWYKMAKYLVGYHVEPPDLRAAYHHERQYGKNPISWIGSIKARAISQHRE